MEEEVVFIKVFDKKRGDLVFKGNVSTDVEPHELVKLRCFCERGWNGIFIKATNERVKSFTGLRNHVELVTGDGDFKYFSGVLYVGGENKVLRKSEGVPSRKCVMMSVWDLSHEECEKAFKCETLEKVEVHDCQLRQIPKEIGKMKNMKRLRLSALDELKSIPEEIGELSSLEELRIEACGIESLPKRLKLLKSICLWGLYDLQVNAEDLVVLSKLKHLTIWNCSNFFTPPFTQSFWEMIKSTTDLRVLELDWEKHDEGMIVAALEENGSIVDGGDGSKSYVHFFKRNRANHERAMECVVHMLAIRRWRNALSTVPKEMVKMIAIMMRNTRCDVKAWTRWPME